MMSNDTLSPNKIKHLCQSGEAGYDGVINNSGISVASPTSLMPIMGRERPLLPHAHCLPHSRTQADEATNVCNIAGNLGIRKKEIPPSAPAALPQCHLGNAIIQPGSDTDYFRT